MKIIPIILAGGSGTRLWPLSRELTPKQLIQLDGDAPLLHQTIARAKKISPSRPLVVTNEKIFNQIDVELKRDDVKYLIEPCPHNTAPAIAIATKQVLDQDNDSIVVVLSADHHLVDDEFVPVIKKAIDVAEETGDIVLLGIQPTRPETGYGYIEYKPTSNEDHYKVIAFREKPDKQSASDYISSGNFLWNAGIFIAKASVLKNEFLKYMPELSDIFTKESLDIEALFDTIESTSIDYGILEKSEHVSVVPANILWNDLGSWGSVYDISTLDKNGNYLEGNVISEDTTGSLIMARGQRRVATIGLQNLVVVDTEDVTLICDRDKTQDVKKIVDKVKQESNNRDYIEHKTMQRPWGRYTVLDEGEGFKVKFIHVKPGGKLSLQKHSKRSEHWVVVKGTARITVDDKIADFQPNESTFVPQGAVHRLENNGNTELTIVEVATGEYIGEDDIIRIEDIYSRSEC